ncbi:uncharacterized protein LOC143900385 isoform X3 [Temnothorax americanus]|uniref:uncharacterized protein LOC143900385 isoform X3 n=1 Tax=Temnothorax americanus TaxID=1964332 RepID=UPI004068C974
MTKTKILDLSYFMFQQCIAIKSKSTIGWQMKILSEPRDNADIFPPTGNLHKSSYRRLGPEDEVTGISETRAMLSQIKLKDEYKPVTYPRRSLLTTQSLASAEKDYEEKVLKLTDILLDPMVICQMNYHTTTNSDYRSPHPLKPRPPPSPPLPEPWLLNRRTIGYNLQDLENRCGYHTFLDDNMDLHQRIAELKMQRGKLYEILLNNKHQQNPIND